MKLTANHLKLYKTIKRRGLSGGCSDISKEELSLVPAAEWQALCKAYHGWNGDIEDYDPKRPVLSDFCVIDFVDHLLLEFYAQNRDKFV